MYCGAPVDKIENTAKVEKTEEPLKTPVAEKEEGNGEYSNCENGIVSFPKMVQKFFSKDIKEYFSFDGTYSRLEYFYARVIIYIALFAICVPCMAVPGLYIIIAFPLTVAFIWLLAASYIKRLKDLNVTLWVMLIPPTCGLFIREEGINVIAAIILICYKACILFRRGKKFNNSNKNFEKNETNKNKKSEEKNTFLDYVGIGIFVIWIIAIIVSSLD